MLWSAGRRHALLAYRRLVRPFGWPAWVSKADTPGRATGQFDNSTTDTMRGTKWRAHSASRVSLLPSHVRYVARYGGAKAHQVAANRRLAPTTKHHLHGALSQM